MTLSYPAYPGSPGYGDDYQRRVMDAQTTPPELESWMVTASRSRSGRRSPHEYTRHVVSLAFGILQGFLVLRILVLLASLDNDVVRLFLAVTRPAVAPFRDVFALAPVDVGSGAVLDVAAVVALIGWTMLEALILGILDLVRPDRAAVA
ncbi:MAG: YggT family protein [Chloroflexota bacterium]|nr:YggT family protein [Chloroflexota bacterium]